MRPVIAALAAVLVLAGALRVHHLGFESLWADEAASFQFANEPIATMIDDTAADVHPPLYYELLHYWIAAFGRSEAAMRSLSAGVGILAVAALFSVGRRLFDEATGLVAAVFLALSPFAIRYSQEARMYALLMLLAIISMAAFVQLTDLATPRRRTVVFYVAATAAMLYTHLYGWFVLAAQALFVLGLCAMARQTYLRVWRPCLAAMAAVIILYLPWLERFFEQIIRVRQSFWVPEEPAAFLAGTVAGYAGTPVLAMLLGISALAALAIESNRRKTALLALWVLCSIVLPFAISKISSPIYLTKYTIAALPAFALLAARGLTLLPGPWLRAGAVLAAASLSVAPLVTYYGTSHKERWRDFTAFVETQARASDVVLFNYSFFQVPYDYYATRRDLVEVPFLEYRDGLTDRSVRELAKVAVSGHDRAWLVLATWDPLTPVIRDALSSSYTQTTREEDRGIEVVLFTRRRGGAEHAEEKPAARASLNNKN